MAKYLIFAPANVGNQFFDASASAPQTITLPDDVDPSRKWQPLDTGAKKALARLQVNAPIVKAPETAASANADTLSLLQQTVFALQDELGKLRAAAPAPAADPASDPASVGDAAKDGDSPAT